MRNIILTKKKGKLICDKYIDDSIYLESGEGLSYVDSHLSLYTYPGTFQKVFKMGTVSYVSKDTTFTLAGSIIKNEDLIEELDKKLIGNEIDPIKNTYHYEKYFSDFSRKTPEERLRDIIEKNKNKENNVVTDGASNEENSIKKVFHEEEKFKKDEIDIIESLQKNEKILNFSDNELIKNINEMEADSDGFKLEVKERREKIRSILQDEEKAISDQKEIEEQERIRRESQINAIKSNFMSLVLDEYKVAKPYFDDIAVSVAPVLSTLKSLKNKLFNRKKNIIAGFGASLVMASSIKFIGGTIINMKENSLNNSYNSLTSTDINDNFITSKNNDYPVANTLFEDLNDVSDDDVLENIVLENETLVLNSEADLSSSDDIINVDKSLAIDNELLLEDEELLDVVDVFVEENHDNNDLNDDDIDCDIIDEFVEVVVTDDREKYIEAENVLLSKISAVSTYELPNGDIEYVTPNSHVEVGSACTAYYNNRLNNFLSTDAGKYFISCSLDFQVDPYILIGAVMQESSLRHYETIPGGESFNGFAYGLFQFENPSNSKVVTAYNFATNSQESLTLNVENVSNIITNIKGGIMSFQNFLARYNNNYMLALTAHNYGSGGANLVAQKVAYMNDMTLEEVYASNDFDLFAKDIYLIHKCPQSYYLTVPDEVINVCSSTISYLKNWKYSTYGDGSYVMKTMSYVNVADDKNLVR